MAFKDLSEYEQWIFNYAFFGGVLALDFGILLWFVFFNLKWILIF